MRLVHDDEIPLNPLQVFAHLRRERIGGDQNHGLFVGIGEPLLLKKTNGTRIDNLTRKIELVLEFTLPLLAKCGRTDHKKLALAFGPQLTEDKPGFDRLSEADLVSQHHTLGKRGA